MATSVYGVRLGVQLASGLAAVAAIKASVKTSFARRMSGWRIATSRTVVEANPSGIVVGTEHDAGKALAAVLREEGFDLGEVSGKAIPVLDPGQRAIDPGGTNFQGPGAGDRILDIDSRAYVMADLLAIVDADLRPISAIGHDLHHRSFAPQDGMTRTSSKPISSRRGATDCGQPAL